MPSSTAFSRELSLLVLCLRQTPDPAQAEALRRHLSQPPDWSEVIVLAERHRLVPHLYLALKNSASDLVPADAWEKIRQRFRANATRNVQFMTELVRVIRSLEQAGIPSMPFKGPALAIQLYGGLECRQFGDLDLLVPQELAVRAAEILRSMGYDGRGSVLPRMTPHQQRWILSRFKDATFFKSHGKLRIMLELHWRLTNDFRFPIGKKQESTERIEVHHGGQRALPLPELTLYLAYHGASHSFSRLSWLGDFLAAVESLTPDQLAALFDQSRELRCERHFVLAMMVLTSLEMLNGPAQQAIWRIGNGKRELNSLVEFVWRAIAAPSDLSHYQWRKIRRPFQLGGWRCGIRNLADGFRPQPDDAFERGIFQAYWHRWCDLFAKYVLAHSG